MSIAVVLDSNSGVTKEEAKELGLFVRPMPFMVDGNVYYEGVDLSHEEFYRKQAAGSDISTSQPSPEDVMGTWDELLKEYDELVYIPMSSSFERVLPDGSDAERGVRRAGAGGGQPADFHYPAAGGP